MTSDRQPEQQIQEPQATELAELLKWLLEFQGRPLPSTKSQEWRGSQQKLRDIAWKLVGKGDVFPASWLADLKRGKAPFIRERINPSQFMRRLRTLTGAEMHGLHQRLQELLEALRPRDPIVANQQPYIRYRAVPARISTTYLKITRERVVRVYGAAWRDLRWLAVAALLEEFGGQIGRCPALGCGKLFIRKRRQAYCSTKCSQYVRSRTWYAKHSEQARALRRAAYEREVRGTRPGANVHVSKRTRRADVKPASGGQS